MSPAELHADSIVIDGLIIAKWNRELFEDSAQGRRPDRRQLHRIGMGRLPGDGEQYRRQQQADPRQQRPGDPGAQHRGHPQAGRAGKTGILYGFRMPTHSRTRSATSRCSAARRGHRADAANTQNLVGTGCYERDGGLSGFGREIVAEMNRVGIMCDLSHVGSKTSEEVIPRIEEAGLLLPPPAVRPQEHRATSPTRS